MDADKREQIHPQEHIDRQIVNTLMTGEQTDYNLAELARLKIRYQGFPGARDIQASLSQVLQKWSLSEDDLYERVRAIHAKGGIYKVRGRSEVDDWS
jgi:hypothetical protein